MQKFNVIALANTLAIIDLILHPLFRLWVLLSPESYETTMHLFVEGLHLEVVPAFDLNWTNFVVGTILEAMIFWLLGASIALIYNRMVKLKKIL